VRGHADHLIVEFNNWLQAVVTATMAELEESGYDKLSIAAVAARAGVHEGSIYRSWRTREGLAMEATFTSLASHISIPDKGSLLEAPAVPAGVGMNLNQRTGQIPSSDRSMEPRSIGGPGQEPSPMTGSVQASHTKSRSID
jgi:Bacterial regulatory proteins, tetR family